MSETQLQGRELDAALARALGWEVDENRMYPVKGDWVLCSDYRALPYYSLSLNAMHDVEAELERRGLGELYAEALIEELSFPELFYDMPTENSSGDEGQETYTSFYGVFQVMHATAEQKARAALAVLNANSA